MSDDKPTTPDIPKDPLYERSLSVPIVIAALAVVISSVLVVYDEFITRRPYFGYQRTWQDAMVGYLDGVQGDRQFVQQQISGLDDYQALVTAAQSAAEASKDRRDALQSEINGISSELTSIREAIKSPRSEIAATSYKAEHAADVAGKLDVVDTEGAQGYLEKIKKVQAREVTYSWTVGDEEKSQTSTVRELIARADELQLNKSARQGDLGAASRALSAAEAARNRWLDTNMGNIALLLDNVDDDDMRKEIADKVIEVGAERYLERYVTGLKPDQVIGLKSSIEDFSIGTIKQLHIQDTKNWVDRCETCHLNARSPMPINAAALGGDEMKLYESHPRQAELFGTHDPEEFGCSMCHGGNGVAITYGNKNSAAENAHGLNHYWLKRMHPPTNFEAGCNQCHLGDIHLEGGERISQAKENFRHYGCWGCHELKGYDVEPERSRGVAMRITDIDLEMEALEQRARNLKAVVDPVFDEDEDVANRLAGDVALQGNALRMQIAGLQTERTNLGRELYDVVKERKKVGPNLKDLRAKVKPEWLTQWIQDPRNWRPSTKMPAFRWYGDDEAKDVAAFLWQSSTNVAADLTVYGMEPVSPGDPTAGEELFNSVGCLACHSIGDQADGSWMGNTFAANLTNLGEKSNLEHVVHWVTNPRHRLAPYCAECKRDLTPADFEKHGEGLVFGREHTACPNCGFDLQWDNTVVMPSLRLNRKEATDIATYLLSQGGATGVDFPAAAPWLEETDRFDRGKRLVAHHGCAGCHEIGGLENEGRIGTSMNGWGSKPMERLDFGHYTVAAKRGSEHHDENEPLLGWTAPKDDLKIFDDNRDFYPHGSWYNHRGFAMHKLAKPEIYDTSKNVDRWSRLRMPKFNLSGQEIYDIVSLLMGSVEDKFLPSTIKYQPTETGQAVREGWWLVRKYNCEGCHQIRPGMVPAIQKLPHFVAGQENEGDRPPYLVGTGFRTRPTWLTDFLRDPSLGGGTANPKSVRPHLTVRMPTFEFTAREARALVRFFDAMAKQPDIYQAPKLWTLSPTERQAAEAIFASANCVQCHVVTGQPLNDETKAPNLSYTAARLRPEWVARWIQNPSLLEPGTAMPALFRKECPGCQALINPDQLSDHPRLCPSCGKSHELGRWVFQDQSLPSAKAYEGDHVDLIVRYLRSLDD